MAALIKALDSFIEESMCKLEADDTLEALRDSMIEATELRNKLQKNRV